jgi:hypothetical protein
LGGDIETEREKETEKFLFIWENSVFNTTLLLIKCYGYINDNKTNSY